MQLAPQKHHEAYFA